MFKKIVLAAFCSALSFVILAIILGYFALTGTTPFGIFLEKIIQNRANSSEIFLDANYYTIFYDALNFVLYFIISPLIIFTGILGALIAKHNEFFVGVVSILPMLFIYIVPGFFKKNIVLGLFCFTTTVSFIFFIRKLRLTK